MADNVLPPTRIQTRKQPTARWDIQRRRTWIMFQIGRAHV